jgi:hypothetical protein
LLVAAFILGNLVYVFIDNILREGMTNLVLATQTPATRVLPGPQPTPREMTERSWIANRMDLDVTVVLSSPTWPTILDIVGDLFVLFHLPVPEST